MGQFTWGVQPRANQYWSVLVGSIISHTRCYRTSVSILLPVEGPQQWCDQLQYLPPGTNSDVNFQLSYLVILSNSAGKLCSTCSREEQSRYQ